MGAQQATTGGGMRIGVLTGGGDCPGLNAVIRAVVRKGEGVYGHQIVGFRHGWRGVVEDEAVELTVSGTRGLVHRGGTILGTSRTNPMKSDDGRARVHDTLERERIDALIVIGGEDTLGVAAALVDDGVSIVGVPKTIDNDLSATDFTFSIVVVAEGAVPAEGTLALQSGDIDEFGHVRLGGIGNVIAEEVGRRTGYETRVTILGHVLRGGTPTAYDRVLATRFGVAAIDAVTEGDFGTMVALRAQWIERVPLVDALRELKTVDPALTEVAEVFFA